MAHAIGLAPWPGSDHILSIWALSSVSVVSPAWARRVLDRVRIRSSVAV